MQTQIQIKTDVRGDEKSPSPLTRIIFKSGESLAAGFNAVYRWRLNQEQFKRDLKREVFHRCLIEALHYPQLFKQARWQ